MEEVIKALLEQNAKLTEQIVELAREAMRLSPQVAQTPMELTSAYPLMHVPESEEDARALHRAGVIDDKELESALAEIGFYNAEMVVPGS